ncbi:hypothetical protein N7495_001830 [Penicillium taxi]|uniref:uncharacterized protein n=1 Tax=Penicillium taxi TaxID=168475 RepID=UPI0025456E18|nr:uncharacterized protein N7495_001830 [Penicillium taxi]KAJ5909148.1 hypothetical protein N7495_001830 [Penicillium taxi]
MSTPTRTIAVVGATGIQGSSVVKTFLGLPGWHVRALTRSPGSENAQSLKVLGAEIVQIDLADPTSLEPAFDGVHAIFMNTNFWEVYRKTKDGKAAYNSEMRNSKNAVEAAARVPTLQRFVYSGFGSMDKGSGGKYSGCYHWESKADVVDYVESTHADGLAKKTSIIYMGAYASNAFLYPKANPETGEYAMVIPSAETMRMPIIDAVNTGLFVEALIVHEEPGKKLLAYDTDSYLTATELIALWSKITGRKAKFVQVTLQAMYEMTHLPFEILNGPAYVSEFGYTAGVDGIIEPEQLKHKVVTPSYEEYLKKQSLEQLLGVTPPEGY